MKFVVATEADKAYFKDLNRACYQKVVERQFGKPWDEVYQSQNFDTKWTDQKFLKVLYKDDLVGGYWVDRHVENDQLRELQIHPGFSESWIGNRCPLTCDIRISETKKRSDTPRPV